MPSSSPRLNLVLTVVYVLHILMDMHVIISHLELVAHHVISPFVSVVYVVRKRMSCYVVNDISVYVDHGQPFVVISNLSKIFVTISFYPLIHMIVDVDVLYVVIAKKVNPVNNA
jgi:hypothetical protein